MTDDPWAWAQDDPTPFSLMMLKGWDESTERLYRSLDAPRYIHSFWQHELSYQSRVVPGVSVTIDILIPHYTDRSK
jgi:hypothetical protein